MQVKLKEQIEIDIDRYNQDNYEKERRIMVKNLISDHKSLAETGNLENRPDLQKILTAEEYSLVKNHLAIINQGRLEALKPEPRILGPSKSPILNKPCKFGFSGLDNLRVLDKVSGDYQRSSSVVRRRDNGEWSGAGSGRRSKSDSGSMYSESDEDFDPGLEMFLASQGVPGKERPRKPKKNKARHMKTKARPQKPKPNAKPTDGNIAQHKINESKIPNISDIQISHLQPGVRKVRFDETNLQKNSEYSKSIHRSKRKSFRQTEAETFRGFNRGQSQLERSKSKEIILKNSQKSNPGVFQRSQSVSTLKNRYYNLGKEAQALKIRAMVQEKLAQVKKLSSEQSESQPTIPVLRAKIMLTSSPINTTKP
jgi:hypothetical protein